MKPATPKSWFRIDYDWSTYWSNGPDEMREAMQTPLPKPNPVRTLADMTPAEIKALEARYNCPVASREPLPAPRP